MADQPKTPDQLWEEAIHEREKPSQRVLTKEELEKVHKRKVVEDQIKEANELRQKEGDRRAQAEADILKKMAAEQAIKESEPGLIIDFGEEKDKEKLKKDTENFLKDAYSEGIPKSQIDLFLSEKPTKGQMDSFIRGYKKTEERRGTVTFKSQGDLVEKVKGVKRLLVGTYDPKMMQSIIGGGAVGGGVGAAAKNYTGMRGLNRPGTNPEALESYKTKPLGLPRPYAAPTPATTPAAQANVPSVDRIGAAQLNRPQLPQRQAFQQPQRTQWAPQTARQWAPPQTTRGLDRLRQASSPQTQGKVFVSPLIEMTRGSQGVSRLGPQAQTQLQTRTQTQASPMMRIGQATQVQTNLQPGEEIIGPAEMPVWFWIGTKKGWELGKDVVITQMRTGSFRFVGTGVNTNSARSKTIGKNVDNADKVAGKRS